MTESTYRFEGTQVRHGGSSWRWMARIELGVAERTRLRLQLDPVVGAPAVALRAPSRRIRRPPHHRGLTARERVSRPGDPRTRDRQA
ncbi:MAG TPA: hypothetical protein VGB19_01740 [Actinomycetota bacterium]|nr:hypothetical protein [Actinomycetota bacterium]